MYMSIKTNNYPGYKQLNNYQDTKLFIKICKFIGDELHGNVADIGLTNLKSEFISCWFDKRIDQIEVGDLNFDYFGGFAYDTIFLFETLEHLTNPAWCLSQIKTSLKENGRLYLSIPARPRILWDNHHYNEISSYRLKKWLLHPLGFEIIRKRRLRPTHHWSFYLKGLRPFLRIFFNYTIIYEIKKHETDHYFKVNCPNNLLVIS